MRFNPNFELEAMFVVHGVANVEMQIWETAPALCFAVEKGYDKIVALLLAREPSATENVRDYLHRAVMAGHTNIATSVHAVNHMQQSALHFAAESGRSVEIAKLLLAANAAIDAVDRDKSSALRRAVDKGRTELVELLLARKALVTDDRDRDRDDYEPLIFRPVIDGHREIMAMLLAHSPQLLDARSHPDHMNALHVATDPEIVQQLLSLNPALLEETRYRCSPLCTAVENNRDKVVAQMLTQCPGAAASRRYVYYCRCRLHNEQRANIGGAACQHT